PPLLVLHRAVLVRQLEEAASLDGKTGLLNAAAWHVQAERALQRAKRRDGPPGVLVLDLDHFKAVNDTHGHLAGDRVLTAVAEVLRDEVRERDLVGRFGGEEFVVMLAGLGGRGPAELEAVAERIRRRVADLRVEIPTPDGPLTVRGLSVSVGCAVMPDGGAELRDLLEVADRALYAAKHAGRNAVRMGTTSIGRPALLPVNARADGADAAEPPALHTNAGERPKGRPPLVRIHYAPYCRRHTAGARWRRSDDPFPVHRRGRTVRPCPVGRCGGCPGCCWPPCWRSRRSRRCSSSRASRRARSPPRVTSGSAWCCARWGSPTTRWPPGWSGS